MPKKVGQPTQQCICQVEALRCGTGCRRILELYQLCILCIWRALLEPSARIPAKKADAESESNGIEVLALPSVM
jgi:hypothetical protein